MDNFTRDEIESQGDSSLLGSSILSTKLAILVNVGLRRE